MTKLLLIRHGESEANNQGFFAGQYDAALMPKGIEQAEKTAKYIIEKYAPAGCLFRGEPDYFEYNFMRAKTNQITGGQKNENAGTLRQMRRKS